MPTTTVKAKDFNNRTEIEKFLVSTYGNDVAINQAADIIIEGKREELRVLHLTDQAEIFGIKCKITDTPTVKPTKKEKPKRSK